MKRSTDLILVTHVGSLVRPDELAQLLTAKQMGQPVDEATYTPDQIAVRRRAIGEAMDRGHTGTQPADDSNVAAVVDLYKELLRT